MTAIGHVILKWLWRLLAFLRVRRQPHPHILRAATVRLDTVDIARAAAAGDPFELPLGGTVALIRVNPATIWDREFRAVEINDQTTVDSPIEPHLQFAGTVVGDEGSEVRLTINSDHVSGYVLQSNGWWFIEPKRKFTRADASDHLIYRTKDLHFRLDYGKDALPVKEEGEGGVNPPHRVNPTVGIAMLADREYEDQARVTSLSWWQQQAAVINQVNGIFSRRVDSDFRVRIFILDRRTTSLTASDADVLLDQVEDPIQRSVGDIRQVTVREESGVEVAHLTTGKNLDGRTLGIAWRPGVYGLSQQQLFWVGGGGGFSGGPDLAFRNMMVATHELGHNFNGVHEEADEWCVTHFIGCWDYERTIMWPALHNDNQPFFSSGSRSVRRNNRRRIQDNFATGRNRNF